MPLVLGALWWLGAAPRVKIERVSKDGWEAAVVAGGKFRPCVGKGATTDEWCDRNCNSIPPNCNSELCKCSKWDGCVSLNGSNRTNLWCTTQRECGINGPPHSSCSNALDQYTNEKIDLNKLCKCHAPAVYATPPAEETGQAQPNWQLTQRDGGQQQEWHDGMDFQPAAVGQQAEPQFYQPPPAAAAVAAPEPVAAAAPDPQWQQPQLPAAEGSFDSGQYHGDQAQPQPQPEWQAPAPAAQEPT